MAVSNYYNGSQGKPVVYYSIFTLSVYFNMKFTYINPSESSIYPGGYAPLAEAEAIVQEFKKSGRQTSSLPLLKIAEYPDFIKMEVQLPGVKREGIHINVQHNVLTIFVLHKYNSAWQKALHVHEFDTEFMEHHILLEENADVEFIIAEFRSGILNLHIPKTEHPVTTAFTRIVVC